MSHKSDLFSRPRKEEDHTKLSTEPNTEKNISKVVTNF